MTWIKTFMITALGFYVVALVGFGLAALYHAPTPAGKTAFDATMTEMFGPPVTCAHPVPAKGCIYGRE